MIAKDLITTNILPLLPNDTVQQALNILSFYHLRELPVVQNGNFVGLVSVDDLLHLHQELPVSGFIRSEQNLQKVSIGPYEHLYGIIHKMGDHKLSCLPVCDLENRFLGLIIQEDVLKAFAEMASVAEPGSILMLDVEPNYSLSEIAKTVEAEDATILSTFVTTREKGKLTLTIKINKQDAQAVIAALEHLGYKVSGSYDEAEYTELLQERYDHLMSYLDV